VLRDEMISINRKQIISQLPIDPNEDLSQDKGYSEIKSENVVQAVTKAVDAIRNRLDELVVYNQNEEAKMTQLVSKARNQDILSYIDPSWHPWF